MTGCAPEAGARLLVCIYRSRNVATVRELVTQAERAETEVRLWALDEVHPDVAELTSGCGPGMKFELCNRLLKGRQVPSDLVVADDDVSLDGELADFLEVARQADLDLCQPAHAEDSIFSHEVTARCPSAVARLTRFVEIGPLFCVRGRALSRVLPFPEDIGMGWGLDVRWSRMTKRGVRLGVVDAVTIRHLEPAGVSYPSAREARRLRWALRRSFVRSTAELQETVATWPVGAASPPWLSHEVR